MPSEVKFWWWYPPYDYFMEVGDEAYSNFDCETDQRERCGNGTPYWWHECDYWFSMKESTLKERGQNETFHETTATEIQKAQTQRIHDFYFDGLKW